MKFYVVLFYIFYLALGHESPEDSDVITCTADNLDATVREGVTVMMFYAPWCGHCKSFAPTLELIATELIEEGVKVGKIDCDDEENKAICGRFEVQGFPTIKIFKDGEAHEYKGGRAQKELVDLALDMSSDGWSPPESTVINLTSENFEEVTNGPFTFVMFFAPWCGHCKKMKPDWEELALEWADNDEVNIAMLDATEEGDLAKKFDVSGYPTLKIFRNGIDYEYKGGRTFDDLSGAIHKESGPTSKEFDSSNQAKRLVLNTRGSSTFYGCFDNADTAFFTAYEEVANAFRMDWLQSYHTFNPEIMEAIGCEHGDTFLVHDFNFRSEYENNPIPIHDAQDVKDNMRPLVGQMTKTLEKEIYGEMDMPLVFISVPNLSFNPEFRKASQLVRNKVLDVANEFKGRYSFVLVDEDEYGEEMVKFGLGDSSEEINVCLVDKDKLYPMEPEETFNSNILKEFIEEFEAGNIERKIKSQKEPKKNNGPVKIITATNFDKIVMSKSSNVLVEFYAPWCGHCKELEPKFKKLGKKLAEEYDDLVIAKMDATANDVINESFEVQGFPTLYWVTKDNEISKYEGGNELKDLKKFIKKQYKSMVKDEL